jgi:tetratricopeptide (TPR) repeat protein
MVSPNGCPEPELLAALAEGTLGDTERAAALRHLEECDDCREVVAGTLFVLGDPARRVRRPSWPVVVAAVAASLVLVAIGARLLRGPASPMKSLVDAAGTSRATEARLSGGFAWGPRSATRGANDAPWRVVAEVGRIGEQAVGTLSPADLHVLAVGQVLLGRADEAIPTLETLIARRPDDPALLADLSAAYLERARASARPDDVPRALDAAERALRSAPRSPEGLFNRAVALEALHLRDQAVRAWDEYLAVDPSSPWAAEARERRAALAGPPSRTNDLQPERERLALELLPAWAESHLQRRPDEPLHREAVDSALSRLEKEAADAFDIRLAGHWRTVSASQLPMLARGHLLHRDGFRSYDANRTDVARPLFAQAEAALGDVHSPFRLWSSFYVALADYYGNRYGDARLRLAAIGREAAAEDFRAVGARSRWIEALIEVVSGDPARAVAGYRGALEQALQAREGENAASLEALLAEALDGAGRRREAWVHWDRALARLGDVRMPRRRQGILLTPALSCEDDRLWYASLALQEGLAERGGLRPLDRAERLAYRARLRLRLGDLDESASSLEQADTAFTGVQDGALRARIAPELSLVRGHLRLARSDFAGAGESFQQALVLFRMAGNAFVSPDAHVGIARAAVGRGGLEEAQSHLANALGENRKAREAGTEGERLAAIQRSLPLVRELASLRAASDPLGALLFWDSYQAARIAGISDATPATLAGWPADRLGFAFVALEDALLRFEVDATGVRLERRAYRRDDLERLARAFQFGLRHGAPRGALDPLAQDLHSALFGDRLRAQPANLTIVIVPDDVLQNVPFAALRDGPTGERIVDRWPTLVAPALRRAFGTSALDRPRALVVGHPLLAPGVEPGLRPLPAAMDEVAAVAAMWGATPLVGAAASRERVLSEARTAGIFHFAGHAIRGGGRRAALLLSPGATGDHELRSTDLSWREPFSRVSLAVLAACRSAEGDADEGQALYGLARPFLAAGISTVVGTLWDVDDRESARLMIDFHRGLRAGHPPASALRDAQRAAIARGGGPDWAAFEVMGAG